MACPSELRNALVAVYGSLKRGQANHHWLQGATFLGRCRLPGLVLHNLGPYPMAVPSPQRHRLIHAELYRLPPGGLAHLDLLEDYPREYDRRLRRLSDGRRAWVYVGRPEQVRGCATVPFGDWGATPVFSYGSNLDPQQLRHRCSSWDGLAAVAQLRGWRWRINKRSQRQASLGFAGIEPCDRSRCWGAVHHLSHADRAALDLREGVSIGQYSHARVMIHSRCGDRFPVLTYAPQADVRVAGLRCSSDYAARILRGAAHHGLPLAWQRWLRRRLSGDPAALPSWGD